MLWGIRPVQQQAAYGLAVDRLKRQIHMGLILPEERLPSERKLAEEVGISRVTLREAFRVLEAEQYIFTKRGAHGGTFVTTEDKLNAIALRRFGLSPASIMRVLEFREANEKTAATLSCSRRAIPELKKMDAAIISMQNANNSAELRQAMSLFKLAMGAASHNDYIQEAIEYGMSNTFLPFSTMDEKASRIQLIKNYESLRDAIGESNEDKAKAAIDELLKFEWECIRNLQKVD